jgi:hypothetical protein
VVDQVRAILCQEELKVTLPDRYHYRYDQQFADTSGVCVCVVPIMSTACDVRHFNRSYVLKNVVN